LVKGALNARGSKLMPIRTGYAFPVAEAEFWTRRYAMSAWDSFYYPCSGCPDTIGLGYVLLALEAALAICGPDNVAQFNGVFDLPPDGLAPDYLWRLLELI
jgi:hypothetical protein